MKKAKSRFRISKFQNPSGDIVWRVSGSLNGERIRKNFRTRAEATGERQRLDIRALNETSDGQQIWTTLTHDQNREAINAESVQLTTEIDRIANSTQYNEQSLLRGFGNVVSTDPTASTALQSTTTGGCPGYA